MPTSSETTIKTLKTVRGRDIALRYTQDNFEEIVVNQRVYIDENGTELTPVTPLLLSRQLVGTSSPTTARLNNSELRHISICFGSSGSTFAQTTFKVIVPFSPGDINQAEQIRELRDYISSSQFLFPKTPLNLVYHGENRS